jgi:hypothetical protein
MIAIVTGVPGKRGISQELLPVTADAACSPVVGLDS